MVKYVAQCLLPPTCSRNSYIINFFFCEISGIRCGSVNCNRCYGKACCYRSLSLTIVPRIKEHLLHYNFFFREVNACCSSRAELCHFT